VRSPRPPPARSTAASSGSVPARTRAALGTPGPGRSRDAACAEIDYLGIDRIGWLRSLRIDGREQLTDLLTDPDRLARLADARPFPPGALAAMGAVATADVHRCTAWRDLPAGAGTPPGGPGSGPVEDRGAVVTGLLASLRGEPGRFVLHVVNGGTVAALPPRLVLELACRVDRSGVYPERTHAPGLGQLGLLAAVRDAELVAVAAVRAGSRSQAGRALAASPLVASVQAGHAVLGRLLDDEPDVRATFSRP
jgi:6-phospho-beta-glucosidase